MLCLHMVKRLYTAMSCFIYVYRGSGNVIIVYRYILNPLMNAESYRIVIRESESNL